MSDVSLANLSPEKRALLELQLRRRPGGAATTDAVAGAGAEAQEAGAARPLSFAQESLWFFDQLAPDSPLYNIPQALRLKGPLGVEALEQALDAIIQRHQILRTRFFREESQTPLAAGRKETDDHGGPVQVVFPHTRFRLPVTDLANCAEAEREGEIQRYLDEEAKRPFKLDSDLMFRASLLRLGAEEHILLLSVHHIAADVWSLGLFYRELDSLYEAFSSGRPPSLPDLPLQYADIAVSQRKAFEGVSAQRALEYWKKELAGEIPVLSAPTDRPRPAAPTFRGAREAVAYPAQLLASIKELGRKEGVTVYIVLLAALQTLLYRYNNQEDVAIGSPIGARQQSELEKMIGLFLNMVTVRADLSGNPPFRKLLQHARQKVLGALAHQEAPLERLVEKFGVARHGGVNPFFQTVFQYLPELPAPKLSGLSIQPLPMETGTAKFDLTLTLGESAEGLIGDLEYNSDLFDKTTIVRMLGHLRILLEGVAANPEQRIGLLPLLSKAEKGHLIEWNETATPYPRDGSIKELFERQVQTSPDSVALMFEGRSVSYQELNAQANRLAHFLIRAGVGPDIPVGVCLDRSVELVAALLGISKAGGAYVPLDPTYPAERLDLMTGDAGMRVIISNACYQKERFSGFSGTVARVDLDEPDLARESSANPPTCIAAENLAYIMYTSGSTGKPKGVLVPQRGVIRLVKEANYVQFSPDDVFLLFAPASFDASTFEIWGSLLNGATLAIFPSSFNSLEQLGEIVQREKVTTLWLTAGLFHQMVEHHIESLKGVRKLLAGGDVLSVPHVLKAARELPGTQLINGYGPTENTTFTCCYSVPRNWPGEGSLPIGRPISNTQVYILDRFAQPTPVGVPGELVIGGDGLALGYLNAPELSTEKFVSNHFTTKSGQKLYRSGDLARWLPDGNIEFLGRLDHQVKIRGFRVEPGEVENALAQHPAVRENVVVARDDVSGAKQLVAYVATRPGLRADSGELRQHLEKRLPRHMVPSQFVLLADFPLTANGKVDRRLLPAPEAASETGPTSPRTAEETALAEIWREVLQRKDIGIHDNFFELGGHSLLATRVISRAAKLTRAEIPLREIFENPTIAALARVMAAKRSSGFSAPIARRSGEEGAALPVSFAQQRLWFLDQLQPNSPFYNIALAIRMQGDLQARALQKALDEILRRHQSLRTNFIAPAGTPMQVIQPPRPVELPTVEAMGQNAKELARISEEELLRPFDLAKDILLRARLLKLGPQERLLLLTVHHIAADGWSMEVLFQELGVLYEAFVNGVPSPLPELPLQYADFALWQREWFDQEKLRGQLAHWRKQLKDAPALELPADRPRPANQSYRGATISRPISPQLRGALESLARSEDATLFMTLLAGFQALLHRYTGQVDITVGSPISGRNRVEIEGLIGFFVNTLVMRTDLSGRPSFREVLRRARETALDAYAHQDLPFEKLVEELQPERLSSYNPFCRVLCTLQRAPAKPLRLPGLELRLEPISATTSKFDLTLYIIEEGNGLSASAEYSTDLFDEATIDRMLGHYLALLEKAASDPDGRIAETSLLAEAEEKQVLVDWNRTETSYPRNTSMGELFERQVLCSPEAPAVVYGGESLTYDELNRAANQVAHGLAELGVGPESMVGVYLDRSLELITALVGIIKAGAAYVPLDQSYPKERLAFMIEDTGMPVILTSRSRASEMPGGTRLVCIDDFAKGPEKNPPLKATADTLAYVIYTSGSTGKPKGVCVPQRAINRLVFNTNYIELSPGDRIAQASNSSFDAATFEIWGALLRGATLVGIDKDTALSPRDLAAEILEQRITTLFLTTALFNQIAADIPGAFRTVRNLLFGGEAVDPKWVREVLAHGPPQRLLHVYGPTETTTFASWHQVTQVPPEARTVPIGGPISNTQFYVLDPEMQPVPIGVPGELYIGGEGVARGYWNRPELTASKFVPNPFAPSLEKDAEAASRPTAANRLYRTGDLVRWLPDGTIEFSGRIDQQVKIRGFRIELEEIEAVLASHASVKKALVTVREDTPGDKRLVAYITRNSEGPAAPAGEGDTLKTEQVAHWQSIFDDHVYKGFEDLADPTFNIKGWISSYTGEAIPEAEMSEWLGDTVSRILERKPGRVLEMGCGTGMLLFRIARQCSEYVGADVSRVALDYVGQHLQRCGLKNVRLLQRSAEDFSGFEEKTFDAVVLNSVVQYFPDVSYLKRVLEQAVRCVRPGGFIFLGDIRSYALVEAFHASVQFAKAEAELPLSQLLRRIQAQISNETELLVHPEFFLAFRQQVETVAGVEILPKRGKAQNELTRFRYQVLLRVGEPAIDAGATEASAGPGEWIDWNIAQLDLGALAARLKQGKPRLLGLRNVPNARLFTETMLLKALKEPAGTAGDLRRQIASAENRSVDPDALRELANDCGYAATLSWISHGKEGAFDVLLRQANDAASEALSVLERARFPEPAIRFKAWHHYGNNPLQAEFARQLAPQLRAFLHDKLPDYMAPAAFVVLDTFPLTPNGKVDRRALPAPDNSAPATEAYTAPRGELEKRLQMIWEEVLGRRAIGVRDNFFDLGGHSLLAVRLFAQVEKQLGKKIPLSSLFQAPTIEKLATLIREGGWAEPGSCLVEIQPLGSRPPVFWLHTLGGGGGGGLFTYQKLAQLLGPEQPSYGLVAPPEPFSTIESMARHYVTDVRRIQSSGPYQLGGYCFGGIIAFEMARQLEAQGHKVSFVGLLDSVPPNVPGDESRINREFVSNFVSNLPLWLGDLLQEDKGQLWWRVHRKTRNAARRVISWLGRSPDRNDASPQPAVRLEDIIDMSHYPADFKRYAQIHWRALVQYVPGSYSGRVHLFRTRKPYRIGLNPEGLWSKLAHGGVELRMIPGRHENILERPYVDVLAREIVLCLDTLRETK